MLSFLNAISALLKRFSGSLQKLQQDGAADSISKTKFLSDRHSNPSTVNSRHQLPAGCAMCNRNLGCYFSRRGDENPSPGDYRAVSVWVAANCKHWFTQD